MLLRLARPLYLVLAASTYLFGASLADYLGKPVSLAAFWLGLFAMLLMQSLMSLLAQVFRLDVEPLLEGETRSRRQILRNNVLYTSLGCIVVVALTTYVLFANRLHPFSSFFFLLLSTIVILVHSIPPLRFVNRGAGEFLLAVHIAYVIPSFAFTLQAGETHRLLALAVPLTLLGFAYFIVSNFQSFAQDQKLGRITFLTRLGWERVVPLHHALILFAYFLFLTSPIFGLNLSLIGPAFLTLPFALFQIFQLRNIALGAKPNWTLLHMTSIAVFGLAVYFLTLTFWLR